MRRTILTRIVFSLSLVAGPAVAAPSSPDIPINTPWKKSCLIRDDRPPCYIGSSAWLECGLHTLTVLLIERGEGVAETLTISVPFNAAEAFGISMTIDQGERVVRPFVRNERNRRTAELETDASLITQLRSGRMLTIEVADSIGNPIILTLSLAGFAEALDGSGATPKTIVRTVSREEMEETLRKSKEESRKRAELTARINQLDWPRCIEADHQ